MGIASGGGDDDHAVGGIVFGDVARDSFPGGFDDLAFDAGVVKFAGLAFAKLFGEATGGFAGASENEDAGDEAVEATDDADENVAGLVVTPFEIFGGPGDCGRFAGKSAHRGEFGGLVENE